MQHWARLFVNDGDVIGPDMPEAERQAVLRMADIVVAQEVHHFRTDALAEIADDIAECTELEDLSQLLWKAATSTGFENFIIFVIRNGSNGTPRSRVCTSCNLAWVERYQSKQYQFVDPVMAAAQSMPAHFLFSDLNDTAPAVQAFWADAEANRIGRNGLCMTFERPDRARIGVSFLTAKTAEQTTENARLNGYDLQVLAALAVDAFSFISYSQPQGMDRLNETELRFLNMLASWQNPEEAFKITEQFGSNKSLQASIRRKLQADTVFQAIAIASARGYFDDLPYDAAEVTRPFPTLGGLEPKTLEHLETDDEAQ